MEKTSKNNWYAGKDGQDYLRQRASSLNDHSQALRAMIFSGITTNEITLLDFGCGSGGVLKRLPAKKRIGVELGTDAAEIARSAGIEVLTSLSEIPDASIDVAISCHAIEHVDNPLDVLQEIKRVVKPGGRIRLVVPCEMPILRKERSWHPNNDRHLYTWTPLLFGNLAFRAGFIEICAYAKPMPTASRLVRWLRVVPPFANLAHSMLSIRRNSLNIILDASVPS